MTKDEIWNESFRRFVSYINFYHTAPRSKGRLKTWIDAQIYNYHHGKIKPERAAIINDMAPGIFVDGVSKSIEAAIRNGTKYIVKVDDLQARARGSVFYAKNGTHLEAYKEKLSEFGITNIDSLFTLLIKESLGNAESRPKLSEVYERLGVNQHEVENLNSILSDDSSNIISNLYSQAIRAKIGLGTIRLMIKVIRTDNLRELIRASIIFSINKELIYKHMEPCQRDTLDMVMIKGANVDALARRHNVARQSIYGRVNRGIRAIKREGSKLLTGQNLSLVEKLSPTLDKELKTSIYYTILMIYQIKKHASKIYWYYLG